MYIEYDNWKLQTPPENTTEEPLICECCFDKVNKLTPFKLRFKGSHITEKYCDECINYIKTQIDENSTNNKQHR